MFCADVPTEVSALATLGELRDRVGNVPGVAGVTFAETLPGGEYSERSIELGFNSPPSVGDNVRTIWEQLRPNTGEKERAGPTRTQSESTR